MEGMKFYTLRIKFIFYLLSIIDITLDIKSSQTCIRLSEKCLSFTDTFFTITHLYTIMKPNLSNVVIFILIEQNGSYIIR